VKAFLWLKIAIVAFIVGGRKGQGGGRPGEKGAGGVREVGKRGREAGEKGNNCATLCKISQSKKCKEAGTGNRGGNQGTRAGTGIKGYGKRVV